MSTFGDLDCLDLASPSPDERNELAFESIIPGFSYEVGLYSKLVPLLEEQEQVNRITGQTICRVNNNGINTP
ncbi:hypothetical protein ES703_122390 [subsurface metagenome]